MYLQDARGRTGPLTESDVQAAFQRGEISPRTMSWRPGERSWQSLGSRYATVKRTHWRGLFLAVGLLSLAVFGLGLPYLFEHLLPYRLRGTQPWAAAAIAISSSVVLALIAYLRSPAPHTRPRGVAAGACLLMLLALIGTSLWNEVRVERARADEPDSRMTVTRDGRVIEISGPIGPNFVEQLHKTRIKASKAERIDINSPGGLVDQAIEAAIDIRRAALPVRVVGQCASACVAVWAGSPQREMALDAQIGLHRAALIDGVPVEWGRVALLSSEAGMLKLLKQAGFNAELLKKREETAPESMHWLSAYELRQNRVLFKSVNRHGSEVRDEAQLLMADILLRDEAGTDLMRMLVAYARSDPAEAMALARRFKEAQASGNERDAGSALFSAARAYGFSTATPDAVTTWGIELVQQLDDALDEASSAKCGTYIGSAEDQDEDARSRKNASLADLLESSSASRASSATPRQRKLSEALVARHIRRHGAATGNYDQESWPLMKRCLLFRDIYHGAVNQSAADAAATIRLLEGVE